MSLPFVTLFFICFAVILIKGTFSLASKLPPPRLCGITAPGEIKALYATVGSHVKTIETTTKAYNESQAEIHELRALRDDLQRKLSASERAMHDSESERTRAHSKLRRVRTMLSTREGSLAIQLRELLKE